MAETQLTDTEANALHGTTDSAIGFTYHTPGDGAYFSEGQRQRYKLLQLLKTVANKFRVYRDGALTYGVCAGTLDNGSTTYSYAGSTANALTDDTTNYIYIYLNGATLTLVKNTTGFPDPATTPHIPLATILTASGEYDDDDITDYRAAALFNLETGATAANLNTLTDGSNGDSLHVHAAAGLASAVQDLMPYLALSGTDDADGTGTMDIQAKDAAGNNLAQRFRVRTWLSTSDYGAPAADTDFSVTTGTQLRELTADADYEAISDATGKVTMNIDLAADGTAYVMAEIDGRIYSGSIAITGN